MAMVKLSRPLMVKGNKVTEVELNFEKMTGRKLIEAEREVRLRGDQTPSVFASMGYQAIIAAKVIGVPVEDLEELPARDFSLIISHVINFLFVAE